MSEILQMQPVRFSFESNETKTSPLPALSAAPRKGEALSEERAKKYDLDQFLYAKTTKVQGTLVATSPLDGFALFHGKTRSENPGENQII